MTDSLKKAKQAMREMDRIGQALRSENEASKAWPAFRASQEVAREAWQEYEKACEAGQAAWQAYEDAERAAWAAYEESRGAAERALQAYCVAYEAEGKAWRTYAAGEEGARPFREGLRTTGPVWQEAWREWKQAYEAERVARQPAKGISKWHRGR